MVREGSSDGSSGSLEGGLIVPLASSFMSSVMETGFVYAVSSVDSPIQSRNSLH